MKLQHRTPQEKLVAEIRWVHSIVLVLLLFYHSPSQAQQFKVLLDSSTACLNRGDLRCADDWFRAAHQSIRQDSMAIDEYAIRLLLQEMDRLTSYSTKDSAAILGRTAVWLAQTRIGDTSLIAVESLRRVAFFIALYAPASPEAESYYERGWSVVTSRYTESPGSCAVELVALGRDYATFLPRRGQWSKAEEVMLTALDVGEKHTVQCAALMPETYFLAMDLYLALGDLTKAEEYALASIEACGRIGCAKHYWYLTYLGEVKHAQRRYDEAERDYLDAVREMDSVYGSENRDIATPLGNLGVLYRETGRFEEALKYMWRSHDVLALHSDNPTDAEIARRMSNLGSLYLALDSLDQAESLLRSALRIRIKNFDSTFHQVARTLNHIGRLKYLKSEYDSAEIYFRKAHAIAARTLPPYHPEIGNYADHLALLLIATGRWNDAVPFWQSARDIHYFNLMSNFPALSEKERERYFSTIKSNFERYNSWYVKMAPTNPRLVVEMFDNQIAIKSFLLRSDRSFRTRVETSSDSLLKSKFNGWLEMKSRIGSHYLESDASSPGAGRRLDSLEQRLNEIEHELARLSLPDSIFPRQARRQWTTTRNQLLKNEAIVEIVRFRHYDEKWTDSVCYAALIVTAETRDYPDLVLLSNGSELEGPLYRDYLAAILPSHPANQGMGIKQYRRVLPSRLQSLYKSYWSAISSKLKGKEIVFLSADGVFHKMNLGTLMTPAGSYVLNAQDIRMVSNIADIGSRRKKPGSRVNRDAVVLARPNYGYADWMGTHSKTRNHPAETQDEGRARHGASSWSDLPFAENEGFDIKEVLEGAGWSTKLYTGSAAVEGVLRQQPSPSLIHIATHGFFLDDTTASNGIFPTALELRLEKNPLLCSGLVFAGANTTMVGLTSAKPVGERLLDDGVLLAAEISNLRLENTNLVVLSACETASGFIRIGEGVYGLQRAFHIAGVEAVMTSLWNIDDHATYRLMSSFYTSYAFANEAPAALRAAQLELLSQGALPCDWGAFVILAH